MAKFIFAVTAGLLGLLFLGMFYAIWYEGQQPTFDLRKDHWTCTKKVTTTRLQYMPVGKVITFVPITDTTCVNWRKNK